MYAPTWGFVFAQLSNGWLGTYQIKSSFVVCSIIPQTVLALRGSGGCSIEAGGMIAGSAGGPRPLTFAAIYSTWCMSRHSRARDTLGHTHVCCKTQ